MYSINKKSTRKRNIKKNKKTKRNVGKNFKKKKSEKNKKNKTDRKTRKRRGGKQQTYYWSPMRKLEFNPDLDSTLSEYERPRVDITDPAYNCKNPVTVIETNQSGGAILVGNNEQTIGNAEISTECPYQAQGASSYAYQYPPGLSNGLISLNNDSQDGGGITKIKREKKGTTTFQGPEKSTTNSAQHDSIILQDITARLDKYENVKTQIVNEHGEEAGNLIQELIDEAIKVKENPTSDTLQNYSEKAKIITSKLVNTVKK